ncbi:ABC transporter substrate-binding protein [[Mycobacterium] wendilense]|uniref:ABC transporter substrate-binding protein n=2 Tax=[Mycobacterium] wendilense TaxID=3064284 RepID=A0ABM9MEX8_9MYCO|nr:ABC transporter substrate-binding protein [Mycolicibacterium sp. MU0050]CAJ1583580.1 ABC transporter substrate-binding protein [Mycolicibacterium sp. MU0050]
MARMRRRPAAAAMAVIAVLVAALVGCGSGAQDQIDYAVDGTLITYNTNSVVGSASAGPQAFARVLSGFGYHGPDGQVVADNDFGSISVVGREPLVLDYQIADNAVYSDGKPITCDDMVLTWAAQSGRYPAFQSASRAGYIDIAAIDCAPGQKRARVSFAVERNFAEFTQLFTATSLLPSHVLADELGLGEGGVTTAIQANDIAQIDRIAGLWNTLWDLKPDIDLKHFPSSGPYRIEAVREDGSVVLVTNEKWWGTPAETPRVIVWPHGIEVQDRINDATFDIVDIAAGSSGTLTTPDGYERVEFASAGIEQLIFAPQGPLAPVEARRALAFCTPRDAIARSAEAPVSNSRLNPAAEDALTQAEGIPEAGQFLIGNPDAARDALGGAPLNVRIGYQTPNARLAATVGAIAKACAPAGITVQDAGAETVGPRALLDGQIDVLIASTGGATGAGSSGASAVDAYTLFAGNGDNLSRYANGQIDRIISELAITVDPKEQVRLLAEGAPVLWNDMPTLPLYRQQRTLLVSSKAYAVSSNPTRWGAGWNMDRWVLRK